MKKLCILLLISLLTCTLFYEGYKDTPTYDEPANMAAAYDYIYRNDFRIYPDNPPLIKLLAGIALFPISSSLKFPAESPLYTDTSQFDLYAFGRQFLYQSGNDPKMITLLARLPNILITIGLGILLYAFAQRLFGGYAGLLALTLFCLDPNIRGHGHILAFDIPLAFVITLILYSSHLFFVPKKSNFQFPISNFQSISIPLLFALGFLTKFTFIFFVPFYFAGLLLYVLVKKNTQLLAQSFTLIFLCIITSTITLWGFGLLTGYNTQTLDYDKLPIIASFNNSRSIPLTWTILRDLPVPYYYKAGMQMMYTHSVHSQPAMLLGVVHAKNDWFFYFPISFLLKTPIPTLIFIFISLIISIRKLTIHKKLSTYNVQLTTLFPFLWGFYFMLMMMIFSHINNVYRYLFPSLVMFILGASRLGGIWNLEFGILGGNKKFSLNSKFYILYSLLTYLLITSIASFPYDLSYTNEFTGIPPKGHLYLSDSEIDWGQDLERLADWLKENGKIDETITLSYLGTADPTWYGIKFKQLQFQDLPSLKGTIVISLTNLYLGDWQYTSTYYDRLKNIVLAPLYKLRNSDCTIVGKSICIFHKPVL